MGHTKQTHPLNVRQRLLSGLSRADYILQLLRGGMFWLAPGMVVASLFIFFIRFLIQPDTTPSSLNISLHDAFIVLLPYMISVALGSILSLHYKLPRAQTAILCMVSVLASQGVLGYQLDRQYTFAFFHGILLPFIAIPIISHLFHRGFGALMHNKAPGNNLRDTINLIVPGFLAICFTALLAWLANALLELITLPDITISSLSHPYLASLLVAGLNSLLWFFGIHGYYALLPMIDQIMHTAALPSEAISMGFMNSFVFIGGAGATFSLILALLLSKHRMYRQLALFSLPIGLFGINEVLLFCLPIILNPRLLLPFVLAPCINALISITALQLGLISLTDKQPISSTPIMMDAWLATGGLYGPLLQLVCIAASFGVYWPFVRQMNRHSINSEIELSQLNATFVSSLADHQLLEDDPLRLHNQRIAQHYRLVRSFEYIKTLTFCLHYQPKCDPRTGRVTGCEALIRATDSNGQLVYPDAFLPAISEAGLLQELDLWVADEAVRTLYQWQQQDIELPMISLNVTAATLGDRVAAAHYIKIIKPWAAYLRVELTEDALASQSGIISDSLNALQAHNIHLDIDDFGTGYSSLNYLNHFNVRSIKIDRSFVLQLDNPKGIRLFRGLLDFAASMQLEVVVEGVDDPDQLRHLQGHEQVQVQGWLYAKAMPPDALISYLQNANASKPD